MVGKAAERYGTEMNTAAILRSRSREIEMTDYLATHPNTSREKILEAMAEKWKTSQRTARITLDYLQRKRVVVSVKVLSVAPLNIT